jgi:hypothetical protein
MGDIIAKLFGPGATPLVEVETQGACSSQCCEEVVSESSDSPKTHPSRHAASSFGTLPPDIETICESGKSALVPEASDVRGEPRDTK